MRMLPILSSREIASYKSKYKVDALRKEYEQLAAKYENKNGYYCKKADALYGVANKLWLQGQFLSGK